MVNPGADHQAVEQSPDGYPRIASFQSSDRSFLQFRGFLDLHCRVLLDLQFDVECLEKELDRLDRSDASSTSRVRQKCLISTKYDREETEWERQQAALPAASTKRARPVVLDHIKTKLTEYGRSVPILRGTKISRLMSSVLQILSWPKQERSVCCRGHRTEITKASSTGSNRRSRCCWQRCDGSSERRTSLHLGTAGTLRPSKSSSSAWSEQLIDF